MYKEQRHQRQQRHQRAKSCHASAVKDISVSSPDQCTTKTSLANKEEKAKKEVNCRPARLHRSVLRGTTSHQREPHNSASTSCFEASQLSLGSTEGQAHITGSPTTQQALLHSCLLALERRLPQHNLGLPKAIMAPVCACKSSKQSRK